MRYSILILVFLLLDFPAWSADWKKLSKEGYAVFASTYVSKDFDGCDYDKTIKLDNGYYFVCRTYQYSYSYRPEFHILKNIKTGILKFIINDDVYEGYLAR